VANYYLQDTIGGQLYQVGIIDLGELEAIPVAPGPAVTPLIFADSIGTLTFWQAGITGGEFTLTQVLTPINVSLVAIFLTSPGGINFSVGVLPIAGGAEFLTIPQVFPGTHPQIVYPSSVLSPAQQVSFAPRAPLRQVPAYSLETERYDNVAESGVVERFWVRTDQFLEFSADFVFSGADLSNWLAFHLWAMQGNPFDYYPELSQGYFTTYTLEDKTVRPEWRSPGLYKFSQKWRQYVAP
jgi:hypothetical protein